MHRLRQFWNGRGYYITRLLYTILMRPMKGFSLIGKEHIPQRSTKIIIVANHESHQDPYLLMSYFPTTSPIHWIVDQSRFSFKERLAYLYGKSTNLPKAVWYIWCVIRTWISVRTMRSCLGIKADRTRKDRELNKQAIREIHALLKEGTLVGFFPESGINNKTPVEESAFVRIALSTHTPILPIAINWKGRRVIVGEEITPTEIIKLGDDPEEKIMRHVYEMRDNK